MGYKLGSAESGTCLPSHHETWPSRLCHVDSAAPGFTDTGRLTTYGGAEFNLPCIKHIG